MTGFLGLVWIVANIVMIIFIIKTLHEHDKGLKKKKRKIWLTSLAVAVGCLVLIVIIGGGSNSTKMEKTVSETTVAEESTSAPTESSKELDVAMNVNASKEGSGVLFDIETNLPDEAELMLTLSKGDYNTDNHFTAQTKVTVKGGKATSGAFSAKGEPLSGDYDLNISMSLPRLQSDAVRNVIGQTGENMKGKLVKKSSIDDSNVVSAIFSVSTGDALKVTPSDDYTHTKFAEEESLATDTETETSGK